MTQLMSMTAVRPWRSRRPQSLRGVWCALVPSLFALAWPLGHAEAQQGSSEGFKIAITPSTADTSAAGPTEATGATALDALVARAQAVHPTIRAAADRLEAARARVGPAGLRPDPMLMAGIQNYPVSEPSFTDFMTMKMVGIGQVLPYPGKLPLRRRAAELEAAAAEARLAAARWEIARETKDAYYELAFLDRALEVVENNRDLLVNFIQVTESRYGVGIGGQQDVLKARVEAARLAEEAVALTEQRRAAQARLNAALARPSDTPVEEPEIPQRIARAAVADEAQEIHFTSAALGARAADSPLPPLEQLQDAAVRSNPTIRAREAMIAAQTARVELARKDYLPDFDVSLQYGQRDGFSDMVSAVVTVPIPLQKGKRQDLFVAEARAELSGLEAERSADELAVRAEVARLYAEMERARAQLALFKKSIIPQGRASLASATAGFSVGRVDFLTLLENQTTLYNYETAYHRLLTDFAQRLAETERVAGKEILP